MKKRVLFLTIILLLIMVISTYAWFTWRGKTSYMSYVIGSDESTLISLTPYQYIGTLNPVLTYLNENYVQIEASNNKSNKAMFNLYYVVNSISNELISEDVKYTITKCDSLNGTYTEIKTGDFSSISVNNDYSILSKETILGNTKAYYRVYLWIDSNSGNQSSMQDKSLNIELRANIVSSNLIMVDLDDGMIPIVFDTDETNTVIKTISADDENWYNYDNKQWANVVLVSDASRNNYLGTSGTIVDENDILAYLVYVPRYKYKIWSLTNSSSGDERLIDIMFENNMSSLSNGSAIDSYLTHPAFVFGDKELNGIWVGKFETTGSADSPSILPNVQSLRKQIVSAQFSTAQKFGTSSYGITSGVDAHMMKNSEWGSVTYLAYSKYGIGENIYINNSSKYYTGRSAGAAGSSSTNTSDGGTYTWDGKIMSKTSIGSYANDRTLGTKASTTGNVYGIYDMSGGAHEYVMAVLADAKGAPRSGYARLYNSGFTGTVYAYGLGGMYNGINFPDNKYYDLYTSTDKLTACNNTICFGHAISETDEWYSNYAVFVSEKYPWFIRGGLYSSGVDAGINYYGNASGDDGSSDRSFRLVLSCVK